MDITRIVLFIIEVTIFIPIIVVINLFSLIIVTSIIYKSNRHAVYRDYFF